MLPQKRLLPPPWTVRELEYRSKPPSKIYETPGRWARRPVRSKKGCLSARPASGTDGCLDRGVPFRVNGDVAYQIAACSSRIAIDLMASSAHRIGRSPSFCCNESGLRDDKDRHREAPSESPRRFHRQEQRHDSVEAHIGA